MEEKQICVYDAIVMANRQVALKTFEMELTSNFNVSCIGIGQFICIAPLDTACTMSRPFSIFRINCLRNTYSILYKVAGKNTELMSKLAPAQRIKVLGLLGKPFTLNQFDFKEIWLAAGGIGIAPLYFLYEKLYYPRPKIEIFYGNKTQGDFVAGLDFGTNFAIIRTTDDGSLGAKGLITELFEVLLRESEAGKRIVVACGPVPMMQRVAEICAQRSVDCWVCLERVMACGLGVCLGCSIKTKSGMKKICADGPIFNAEEVIWDELKA